jgi:Holliday junction resolvase RusA-like endonuclease
MITLELSIKPYSVNKYFYGNRAVKRREAVQWETCMIELLRPKEYQEAFEKLKEEFDPKKHCLTVEIVCYYPNNIIFRKDGALSSKAFDISNTEKPIIDVIFLEKYATSTINNIGIDDKYIVDMVSKKRASEKHKIEINIQLKTLQYLEDK